MARVNLPSLKIPQKFLADPEVRDYMQARDFALYQLFQRTCGGGDTIENNVTNTTSNTTNISINTAAIANIDNVNPIGAVNASDYQKPFYESVQSANYQTFIDEIIKLSADITITLNPYPLDKERVYVKSATGKGFSVTSTRKIDGHSTIRYNKPYIGRWFSYSIELNTWSIL